MRRVAFAAIFAAVCVGCVFVVDPDVKTDPPRPPPATTVPVPFPTPEGKPLRVAQLWLVPVDPGVTTLATAYTGLKAQVDATLQSNGATLVGEAVLSLRDDRRLWATPGFDAGPPPVSLEEVLRYYAAASDAGGSPVDCTSYTLAKVGQNVSDLHVTFPEELVPWRTDAGEDAGEYDAGIDGGVDGGAGASVPGPPFLAPLAQGFDALLVVIVDSGARTRLYDFCGYNGQPPAQYFTNGTPLSWLHQGNQRFAGSSVAFAFVATPEDAGFSAMRKECLAHPAFPRAALDVISPSSIPFYTRWSDGAAQAQSLTRYFPFCEAVAGDWDFGEFVNQWARGMSLAGAPK